MVFMGVILHSSNIISIRYCNDYEQLIEQFIEDVVEDTKTAIDNMLSKIDVARSECFKPVR